MTDAPLSDVPQYLPVPANSCLGSVDGHRWVGTVVIRVGRYHVAIRASTPEVAAALRSALRRHVVEDARAPASYGVYQTRPSLPSARPLYRVYEGCKHIFTALSLDRAIVFVAGYLEQLLPRTEPVGDTVHLGVHAVVGRDGAVLVPWTFPNRVPELELRLARAGIRQLERFPVSIDVATNEVVVEEPKLVDMGQMNGAGSAAAGVQSVTWPWRRSIRGWVFLSKSGGATDISRAHAVARGMKVAYGQAPPLAKLQAIVELVRDLELLAVTDAEEAVRLLRDELGCPAVSR